MGSFEDAKLWNAIGRRDASALRKALAGGANPNARGHATLYGRDTMLQVAAENLDEVAVEVLLSAGARQTPGRHKVTPLIALALAIPSASTPTEQARLLKALDLLLAKKPNLEPEGGDPARSSGNAVFHVIRQPISPFVETVQDRFFEAMAARKKRFSDDFSSSVLMAAFNFRSPTVFEQLVEIGLDPQSFKDYPLGPAARITAGMKKEDVDAWWPVLAIHNVPVGVKREGMSSAFSSAIDLAQAKVTALRMEWGLDQAVPSASARPRL